MPSSIFTALLDEKIRTFVAAYQQTAHQVFFDEQSKKLRHAGEYGAFRELVVREFLRFFTPGRLDIHNGFIITATDKVSTQCDVVVYDAKNTPLIESGERQRFFPVESACIVGEIKSRLSKVQLKDALNKLARIKALREEVPAPTVLKRDREGPFDPVNYAYDQLPTFLICERLDFDLGQLPNQIDSLYDSSVERRHRHNLILSLQDGLIAYADKANKTLMFPEVSGRITPNGLSPHEMFRNRFVIPKQGDLSHIRTFCSYMFLLSSSTTILYPDITSYMHSGNCSLHDQDGA
ncbi:DUF6602 domain-containing protein [Comamonas sp. C11]|uniref:DUF6602 domain-containing protein n=1 Tax=Comamonas sp. C11 TaxID=2966554 RepID=UPI00211123AC|nr:DUF6602 domain-containing protein [Comamonas sp. C11]UUC92680.1 hypothetical protein NOX35_20720 [Comamonas sp. C11]